MIEGKKKMTVYIALIGILFISSVFFKLIINEREKQEQAILFVVILCMFCICAFRKYTVGIDTPGYKEIYDTANKYAWGDYDYVYFEPGYIFLMKLFASLHLSFNTFLVGVYMIVFIPLYVFLKKYSRDVTFSLLIYICYNFFTFNLTGIRNSMAISLCLLAFCFLTEKTKKGFIIALVLTFLAFRFHKSAVVFLAVFAAVYFPFKSKTMLMYILITAALIISPSVLFNFANSKFDKSFDIANARDGLGGAFLLQVAIFVFIFILLNWKNIRNRNNLILKDDESACLGQKKNEVVCYMHMLYFAILSLIVIGGASTMIRAAMFFQIFLVLLLPSAFELLVPKERTIVKMCFGSFLLLYYYMTVLAVNKYEIIPYSFFWQ